MNGTLQERINEMDTDDSPSWIIMNGRVGELAAELSRKAAGTALAADAERLSMEVDRLCDHVDRLHADVTDLMAKLEATAPQHEPDTAPVAMNSEELDREWMRIQRQNHELRADFMDVLKALFLWRDEPSELSGRER